MYKVCLEEEFFFTPRIYLHPSCVSSQSLSITIGTLLKIQSFLDISFTIPNILFISLEGLSHFSLISLFIHFYFVCGFHHFILFGLFHIIFGTCVCYLSFIEFIFFNQVTIYGVLAELVPFPSCSRVTRDKGDIISNHMVYILSSPLFTCGGCHLFLHVVFSQRCPLEITSTRGWEHSPYWIRQQCHPSTGNVL